MLESALAVSHIKATVNVCGRVQHHLPKAAVDGSVLFIAVDVAAAVHHICLAPQDGLHKPGDVRWIVLPVRVDGDYHRCTVQRLEPRPQRRAPFSGAALLAPAMAATSSSCKTPGTRTALVARPPSTPGPHSYTLSIVQG